MPNEDPAEVFRHLYYSMGVIDERERIIKLLEADICPDATLTCCDGWCGAYKGAIALIKEEQK